MISVEEYQLTEKRIDACFLAAEQTDDNDMKNMWYQKGMALVRKLNFHEQNGSVAQPDRATAF